MHRYLPAIAGQLGGRVTEVVVNHRPRRFGTLEIRALAHVPRGGRPGAPAPADAGGAGPAAARGAVVRNRRAVTLTMAGPAERRPRYENMSYRTPLEARIAKKTTKAITDFNLIEDGDRIMVGLSGGKDSWALLQTLDILRQRAPITFSLVAVNVDSGYKDFKHDVIARTCEERGWEYRIEHTEIGEVMDDILEANATPCSLCARLRRGVLYRIAARDRRHQDRARPSPRRLHRDAAAQSVLRRGAQGDAGAAGLGQRRARGHPAARLRRRGRGAPVHQGGAGCRSSAAAARRAAISACSGSASSG